MTDDRTPTERAEDELSAFIEALELHEEDGEPLNMLISDRVRESTEMYLRGVAEAMAASEGKATIIGEMAIAWGAEQLPHATKGQFREALASYLTEQRYLTDGKAVEELGNNGES
jgi:hypothetical protein